MVDVVQRETRANICTEDGVRVVVELDQHRPKVDAHESERRGDGEQIELETLEGKGRHQKGEPDEARQQRDIQPAEDALVLDHQERARQSDPPCEVDRLPEVVLRRGSIG